MYKPSANKGSEFLASMQAANWSSEIIRNTLWLLLYTYFTRWPRTQSSQILWFWAKSVRQLDRCDEEAAGQHYHAHHSTDYGAAWSF